MSSTPRKDETTTPEPTPPESTEGYTPEEEEEVQKRLEDLGYI